MVPRRRKFPQTRDGRVVHHVSANFAPTPYLHSASPELSPRGLFLPPQPKNSQRRRAPVHRLYRHSQRRKHQSHSGFNPVSTLMSSRPSSSHPLPTLKQLQQRSRLLQRSCGINPDSIFTAALPNRAQSRGSANSVSASSRVPRATKPNTAPAPVPRRFHSQPPWRRVRAAAILVPGKLYETPQADLTTRSLTSSSRAPTNSTEPRPRGSRLSDSTPALSAVAADSIRLHRRCLNRPSRNATPQEGGDEV